MAIIPEFWPGELTSAIAMGALVAGVMHWFQQRELRLKNDRIKELEQSLGLRKPESPYRQYTNQDLARLTLDLASRIRKLLNERSEGDLLQHQMIQKLMGKQELADEVSFKKVVTTAIAHLRQENAFDEKFKVDALLLKEELQSRLPESEIEQLGKAAYENPTHLPFVGTNYIREVVDDLERLGKILEG